MNDKNVALMNFIKQKINIKPLSKEDYEKDRLLTEIRIIYNNNSINKYSNLSVRQLELIKHFALMGHSLDKAYKSSLDNKISI